LFCEELAAAEDWDMWLRLAYAGVLFLYSDDLLALYRRHDGSMMTNWESQRRHGVQVLERFRKLVQDKDKLNDLHWPHYAAKRYLLWALSLFQIGKEKDARVALERAWSLDKHWLNDEVGLTKLIVEHSLNSGSTAKATTLDKRLTSFDYVKVVLAYLPPDLSNRQRLVDRAYRLFWVASAFDAHRAGNPRQVWASCWRAILSDPTSICNRGLVSVFLQSCLGVTIWKKLHVILGRSGN